MKKDNGPVYEICMFPGCKRPRYARGMCHTHYQYGYELVKGGKTTWAKLEQTGKVKPARKSLIQSYFLDK